MVEKNKQGYNALFFVCLENSPIGSKLTIFFKKLSFSAKGGQNKFTNKLIKKLIIKGGNFEEKK